MLFLNGPLASNAGAPSLSPINGPSILGGVASRPIALSNCIIVGSTIVCDCEQVYQGEGATFIYDNGPGDLGTVGGVAGDVASFAEAITNNSTVPVP